MLIPEYALRPGTYIVRRTLRESDGHIQIPILGDLVLDRLAENRGGKMFHRFLKSIETA